MTFDEAKEKLKRIRYLKNKARDIVADINECNKNKAALSLKSALNGSERVSGSKLNSVEERILLLIEKQQRRLEKLLDEIMHEEDILNEAIQSLTETEQDIIIGYYMRDKSHRRLAREMSYSEGHIKYLKRRALEKIADKV